MFATEREPLFLLVEITPRLAKKRFRDEIYKAWDYSCGYCGEPATSLDHIIPKFRSGSSMRHNLLPCCRCCNANKSTSPMEEWYRSQEFFEQARLDSIITWAKEDKIELTSYSSHLKLGIA